MARILAGWLSILLGISPHRLCLGDVGCSLHRSIVGIEEGGDPGIRHGIRKTSPKLQLGTLGRRSPLLSLS